MVPALPEKWVKGSVSGLLARGGVEVSVAWDQEEGSATVELKALKRDQAVTVKSPFGQKIETVDLEVGEVRNIRF